MGDPLSYSVIGEAMAVHRELGPGVREEFYHRLLAARLRAVGIEHWSKPRRELLHRGVVADVFEPDIVVPAGLVLELKHLHGGFAPEHFVQLKSYLKFWSLPAGLLFDFGKESLHQQRYVFTETAAGVPAVAELLTDLPAAASFRPVAESVSHAFVRVARAHGFGYRDTTYAGLLRADFAAEGMRHQTELVATVTASNTVLGQSQVGGLLVEGKLILKVISQRDGLRPADRAIVQTWMRLLDIPGGLIAHFGKSALEVQWVLPAKRHAVP